MYYKEYTKYVVDLPGNEHEIAFYKSPRSDRWWMDVPIPTSKKNKRIITTLFRAHMRIMRRQQVDNYQIDGGGHIKN